MALEYRPDIDGLRALAVLPVVAFHYGVPGFSGGFVGVDVFFVISGFLITSIISGELARGEFSIARFYVRRIRRIFPALFAVIAVCLVVATLLFLPEDLSNLAQSAGAATFFVSNVLFFLEAGYFDAAAYTKPLLHTWSLAIEEQFYIFIPLLLMLLARFKLKPLVWILAITLVSLALSVLTTSRAPTAAYYLLPWRAWELGIGALLALGVAPALTARWLREGAAALGVALILFAVFWLDKSTPFPGAAALLPTIGAALVIVAGRAGPSLTGRALGSAMPVWIGKLSYSLYLWHWPIVVFFVYMTFDMPDLGQAAGLFTLALILSFLSWRFIERPFRRMQGVDRAVPVFGVAAVAMLALVAVSGALVVTKGLPGRMPPETRQLAAFNGDMDPRTRECFRQKTREGTWLAPCIYGDLDAGPPRVALWGDSHGPALIPALDTAGQAAGVAVALYAHDGCPGLEDFQVYWTGNEHDCSAYLDDTVAAIIADPDIEMVVYTMRAQLYTEGWLEYGFVERDRGALKIGPRAGALSNGESRVEFFVERLERTIQSLRDAGKEVVLVYPMPEAGARVPEAVSRLLMRGGQAADLVISREMFDARSAPVIAAYDALVERADLLTVRADEWLCDDESCRFVLDGTPVFRDSNHLSATAARMLAPEFELLFDKIGEPS